MTKNYEKATEENNELDFIFQDERYKTFKKEGMEKLHQENGKTQENLTKNYNQNNSTLMKNNTNPFKKLAILFTALTVFIAVIILSQSYKIQNNNKLAQVDSTDNSKSIENKSATTQNISEKAKKTTLFDNILDVYAEEPTIPENKIYKVKTTLIINSPINTQRSDFLTMDSKNNQYFEESYSNDESPNPEKTIRIYKKEDGVTNIYTKYPTSAINTLGTQNGIKCFSPRSPDGYKFDPTRFEKINDLDFLVNVAAQSYAFTDMTQLKDQDWGKEKYLVTRLLKIAKNIDPNLGKVEETQNTVKITFDTNRMYAKYSPDPRATNEQNYDGENKNNYVIYLKFSPDYRLEEMKTEVQTTNKISVPSDKYENPYKVTTQYIKNIEEINYDENLFNPEKFGLVNSEDFIGEPGKCYENRNLGSEEAGRWYTKYYNSMAPVDDNTLEVPLEKKKVLYKELLDLKSKTLINQKEFEYLESIFAPLCSRYFEDNGLKGYYQDCLTKRAAKLEELKN